MVWNVILLDRCKTSDTFSSVCLQVAKTLASVGRNERCFWQSFAVAGPVPGELGRCSRILFCEIVVIVDLGMMMMCGRCSTSDASGSFFVASAVLKR